MFRSLKISYIIYEAITIDENGQDAVDKIARHITSVTNTARNNNLDDFSNQVATSGPFVILTEFRHFVLVS